MIEPLERAPLRVRDAELAPATLGAGSVLTLPFGEIAGDFHPMDLPQRRGRARYELLVSNDTPVPVASFAYALDGSQPGGRLTWNAIVVPPHSAVALEIEIVLPRAGRSSRVVAELHFEESKLVLDAPPPSPKGGPFLRRTLMIVAGLAFFCIGGLSIAREPHVLALGAPDAARGGTPFQVAYALGNSSRAEYVVETPDGLQVRRGNLPSSSGAFTLDLPTADVSNGYDVRVTAQGLFGTDSRTTHVLSLPFVPPPAITTPAPVKVATVPSAARIAAVSLARDEVHGGEPIVVDYRTSAEAGSVRLIDQLGTIRAEALLSRHGRSIVIAPFVDADQDFRVVVTAERGGARDDAAVSVRVLQTTMPPPGAPAVPDATGATAAGAGGASPIALDATVDAGSPIVVQILRHEPALHLSLVDATGAELAAIDVPPDATSVTLATKSATSSAQVSVIASYAKGFAQESVIRAVTVRGLLGNLRR